MSSSKSQESLSDPAGMSPSQQLSKWMSSSMASLVAKNEGSKENTSCGEEDILCHGVFSIWLVLSVVKNGNKVSVTLLLAWYFPFMRDLCELVQPIGMQDSLLI